MSIFKNDPHYYPFRSARKVVYARRGMVATSQPQAAQAGLDVLRRGGNAIDAAIATATTLAVVEPTSNGIGGDAFTLVWYQGELYGLNSSGPAPADISIEKLKERGLKAMPKHGMLSVSVPGTPGAWAVMADRFGALPLNESMKSAIEYAEQGYAVSPTVAANWAASRDEYSKYEDPKQFGSWFDTFTKNGQTPQAGDMWIAPGQAATLKSIAETDARSFYQGDIAQAIDAYSRQQDGFLNAQDLAAFVPEWVDPIGTNYRGYDVWEIPPNGQGIIALMALNIMKEYEIKGPYDIETVHRQIEAIKLSFTDALKYVTDPRYMKFSASQMLSPEYAALRRSLIGERALTPEPGDPAMGGTVYLATADDQGNMVSYIQSNYKNFGSGMVVPGTGIALQNRAWQFSLNPEDHNALAGGKKTYHTIIPGFITHGSEAVGPFGVMGGYMQPQGHLQVAMNLIDFGLNPQAALDAPRWLWMKDKEVQVEPGFPVHLAQALARKGHNIVPKLDHNGFGRGQVIVRNPDTGVLVGGTEPRTDGQVASY